MSRHEKTKKKLYKINADNPPNKLKITGVIFIFVFKNSASNNNAFLGNIKIELPQKSVPNPTIISLKK